MLSQYFLFFITLTDVLVKLTVADLIATFLADVIAIVCVCEMVIPHMLVVII